MLLALQQPVEESISSLRIILVTSISIERVTEIQVHKRMMVHLKDLQFKYKDDTARKRILDRCTHEKETSIDKVN